MPEHGASVVILAQSGRMLAQSAARAGWRTRVLDLYGDEDTRACSERCALVDDGGGFDHGRVLDELRRAAAEGARGLVYGSGLECAPDWLDEIAGLLPVWGNSPDVLRWLKSPPRFFALLDELGIPYPESCFQPPDCPDGWLLKPGCGEGGKGVAFCAASAVQDGAYYQRHIAGTPMSALFLADGNHVRLVGFNALWTTGAAGQPFGFAGASNRPDLPPVWRGRVADWTGRLARRVGLKGLGSLDFVYDGDRCWALEVNPRPSATLALYDADFPDGLLAAHVRACGGALPESVPLSMARAMRIVYAPRRLKVPAGVVWPSWCADLPAAESEIAAGEPLCSVAVEGGVQDLPRLSRERERMALELCRPL
ncbi:ATP-grasp domain-containing protein [Methylogaea oryzae]|uniref:ATP-grasp fold PylC-type domain-containing protein n=1 Tax=Methylogaea oryzae TaxID=1295382 RepID=A0A8D4VTF5_9GAMM|nr:ATP-grasp domain-containing protein [Methylogaea oryzae]BBL72282.1 hypothetical protein MoryE10_28880 [Methylogaea oryzae]